ncbi:hypothetical protein TIFTF001_036413, partial [Ficus carica]
MHVNSSLYSTASHLRPIAASPPPTLSSSSQRSPNPFATAFLLPPLSMHDVLSFPLPPPHLS